MKQIKLYKNKMKKHHILTHFNVINLIDKIIIVILHFIHFKKH